MTNNLRDVLIEKGYRLRTWDTDRTIGGKARLGYELKAPTGAVLFTGEDFGCSPLHATDSDKALRALCGFLFLRPGDTDRDYFDGYSADQMAFAESSDCELLAFLYSEEGPGKFEDVKPCECTDPGCPCGGRCQEPATLKAHRIDMEDETGVAFCERCGADALESGVFAVRDADDVAEWEEQGYTHHGLPVFEHDGETFAYAADDDEADAAAKEAALDSLWAFRSEFLSGYVPALRNTRARVAFDKMREALCEDASELVAAMIGEHLDRMLFDAVGADGRGHFLAPYDGEERDAQGRPGFTYRID